MMWNWFRRNTNTEHAGLLPRYKHLRQVGLRLNHRLVDTLLKSVLDEGGKRLGILKRNTLVLDSEDELAVLMDYCIYDVRPKGVNAVERFLAESPPGPETDEMVLLQAMRHARYCVFAVEEVERGVGVRVRDLLRDEPLFLVDVGFGSTARPGLILAGRVMAPEGISMTTGAVLPVGELPAAERDRLLQSLVAKHKGTNLDNLLPEQMSEFVANVIRGCLRLGAADHIAYTDPGSGVAGRRPARSAPRSSGHVGRNDPCPCGSGKKFKHCCGRGR
jgi:hypothetical protein